MGKAAIAAMFAVSTAEIKAWFDICHLGRTFTSPKVHTQFGPIQRANLHLWVIDVTIILKQRKLLFLQLEGVISYYCWLIKSRGCSFSLKNI